MDKNIYQRTKESESVETYLLNRISKLSSREFQPESLDGGQISVGDVLHISEVNEVSSLLLGPRDGNKRITGELSYHERK